MNKVNSIIKPINQVDFEDDNFVIYVNPCGLPYVCDSDVCADCNHICKTD